MRTRRLGLGVLAALAVMLLPPAQAVNKPEMVRVIVTYNDRPSQAQTDRAGSLGGQIYRAYEHLPMRAISIPEHALTQLANGKGVRFVAADGPVEAFSLAARQTARAPSPDSKAFVSPAADVTVAVLDSGISKHQDLTVKVRVDCVTNPSVTLLSTTGCATVSTFQTMSLSLDAADALDSNDPFGHGTHVAGTIGGSGSSSYGAYPGFAPGAAVNSVRVLNSQGQGVVSDVLAGLDWVLANASTRHSGC